MIIFLHEFKLGLLGNNEPIRFLLTVVVSEIYLQGRDYNEVETLNCKYKKIMHHTSVLKGFFH